MNNVFFQQLNIPYPDYDLEVGSGTHAQQTGQIMIGCEKIWMQKKPSVVLVQGDTNSVLAAALAAVKLDVTVGHVEAGLRSFDRTMPEEINRVVADQVSDFNFAPTDIAMINLFGEGCDGFLTGNTIVDAIRQNKTLLPKTNKLNNYFLATVHRAENVDNIRVLMNIFEGLESIRNKYQMPIVFPIHPRTDKILKETGLNHSLTLIPPQDYLTFLNLEKNAKVVLTDSGGVQEEACILGIPCVTLRDNTERPETISVGANVLAGTDPIQILYSVDNMINIPRIWRNPFGDGHAAEKILDVLDE
jgi:UDP-N-acetylglucosamine 2-epimerase (non-hydrolysing)